MYGPVHTHGCMCRACTVGRLSADAVFTKYRHMYTATAGHAVGDADDKAFHAMVFFCWQRDPYSGKMVEVPVEEPLGIGRCA